jgi:hypothetical protein
MAQTRVGKLIGKDDHVRRVGIVAPKFVGCSGLSGGTTVHGHGLEGEPLVVRDAFTRELNDAHAPDSVAGTIASQGQLLELIPIVGRPEVDRCLDIGSYAHRNLDTVEVGGIA